MYVFLHYTKEIVFKITVTYLPAFLTNPESANPSLQISQRKQSGCQLACMALITRPITNFPTKQGVCQVLKLAAAKPLKKITVTTFKTLKQYSFKTLKDGCCINYVLHS